MGLNDFYRAVYKRKGPVTSQAKFLQSVFRAAESKELIDDEYARKLFTVVKPISEPQYGSFSTLIDRGGLLTFLKSYASPIPGSRSTLLECCQVVAEKAALSRTLHINSDPFLLVLTDWFEGIVYDPRRSDFLKSAYQLRGSGAEPEPFYERPTPLYPSDRADVIHPPATQDNKPAFYAELTHQWVVKNTSNVPWQGHTLVCVNPKNPGICLIDTTDAQITDNAPSKTNLIKVECRFSARGREGMSTSIWEMRDNKGGNCFPGEASMFNVVVTIMNPNVQPVRGRP